MKDARLAEWVRIWQKAWIAFALAIVLVFSCFVKAQHHEQFETAPEEVKSKFESKQKQIIQELESSQGNEWAGDYWTQIGLINGALFSWSPANGFTVRSGNDFHRGVERVNYGNANFNGKLLMLSPEHLEKGKHIYSIPTSFVPIRWDKQHWLIPSDKLVLFIYAVNSGDYDEIHSFFVKYEDTQKPNKGLPDVPKEYRKYLNRKPIKAKVVNIKVNNEAYSDYTFTLNVGKAEGVIEEMVFYLINAKDVTASIKVTDVGEHTSLAHVISIGSSGKEIKPSVGWKFSSKIPPLF